MAKHSKGAASELSPSELKDTIKYLVKNNAYLQSIGRHPIAMNVVGEAGTSKTSCIEQVAKEMGLQYVKLNLSQMEDPSELSGFPYKEYQVRKGDKTAWVHEHALPEFIEDGFESTGDTKMSYAAPEWIKSKDDTKGGILCLDDSLRGNLMLQQASMELLDRQENLGWRLPNGWTVISTNNPDDGNYQVTSVDSAFKTRQMNVNIKWDVNDWALWAELYGVDKRC